VGGTTALSAAGFDVTLDDGGSAFGGAVSSSGASVTLVASGPIALGVTTATVDLSVTAAGAITQQAGTALNVGGTTALSAAGFDITLDETGNDFTGAVSVLAADDVTLRDANTLVLGTWSITGTLQVTADDVEVERDANFTLTDAAADSELTVDDGVGGDEVATLTVLNEIRLTGGTGPNTFSISGFSGTANLVGSTGDDVYAFGDAWGEVSIDEAAGESGFDLLDFTDHSSGLKLQTNLQPDDLIVSVDGSRIEFSGETADNFDFALEGAAEAMVLKSGLVSLVRWSKKLEELGELDVALPLMSQDQSDTGVGKAGVTLAGALDLSDVMDQLRQEVETYLDANPGASTARGVVEALLSAWIGSSTQHDAADSPLRDLGDLAISASSGTGAALSVGANPDDDTLELKFDLDFLASRETAGIFDLDLGSEADLIGVSIDAKIDVTADLTASLALGLALDGSTDFFVDDPALGLEVTGTATIAGAPVNFGLLEAIVQPPVPPNESIEVRGGLDVAFGDPGADDPTAGVGTRVSQAELVTSTGLAEAGGDVSDLATLNVDPAKDELSTDLPLDVIEDDFLANPAVFDGAELVLTFPAGSDVFSGDAPLIAAGTSTLGADLLDFSNISPLEAISMLDQLGATLASLSASELLNLRVPLAQDLSIGDLLDFGEAFKIDLLDPLFVSGDSDSPDVDGDGSPDLTFDSVQDLAEQMTASLNALRVAQGMAAIPNLVQARYAPDLSGNKLSSEVTFDIAWTHEFDALDQGSATIETTEEGAPANEIQRITVYADAGTFTLTFEGETTDPIAFGATDSFVQTALADLSTIGRIPTSGPDNVSVVKDGDTYTVTFVNDLAAQGVAALVADGSGLTATDGDAGVGIETVTEGSDASGDEVQTLTIDATGGTFRLRMMGGAFTPSIDFDAEAAVVESALEELAEIGADNVEVSRAANVYTITFIGALAGGDVDQLDVDASGLTNEVPVDFSLDLGQFTEVESSSTLGQSATVSLDFTFGIDLLPSQAVVASPPVFRPVPDVDVDTDTQGSALDPTNPIDEVQIVTVSDATAGSFRLVFGDERTELIPFGAEGATVQSALAALSTIGQDSSMNDNVEVTRSTTDEVYTVNFLNDLGGTNVEALSADPSDLRTAVDSGVLSAPASFELVLFDKGALILDPVTGAPQFEDAMELIPLREPDSEVARFTITIDPADVATPRDTDALQKAIQDAIDLELFAAGENRTTDSVLGIGEAGLSDTDSVVVASRIAPSSSQLGSDLRFRLVIDDVPGDALFGTLRAGATDGADGSVANEELSDLAADLEAAVAEALGASGLAVEVSTTQALSASQPPAGAGAGPFELSDDATFTLRVTHAANGVIEESVVVAKGATNGDAPGTTQNQALSDLVDDLNAAIAGVPGLLDITGNPIVTAGASEGLLVLSPRTPGDVESMELEFDPGNPAAELGFSQLQGSLEVLRLEATGLAVGQTLDVSFFVPDVRVQAGGGQTSRAAAGAVATS
jgi:hypothetical protein